MSILADIQSELDDIRAKALWKTERPIVSPQESRIRVAGDIRLYPPDLLFMIRQVDSEDGMVHGGDAAAADIVELLQAQHRRCRRVVDVERRRRCQGIDDDCAIVQIADRVGDDHAVLVLSVMFGRCAKQVGARAAFASSGYSGAAAFDLRHYRSPS